MLFLHFVRAYLPLIPSISRSAISPISFVVLFRILSFFSLLLLLNVCFYSHFQSVCMLWILYEIRNRANKFGSIAAFVFFSGKWHNSINNHNNRTNNDNIILTIKKAGCYRCTFSFESISIANDKLTILKINII